MFSIESIGGIALFIVAAGAAVLWPRRSSAALSQPNTAPTLGGWQLPASAAPYAATIRAAELRHGIPSGLLGRLLYQESRFRADVIEGRTVSAAGAVGIAQIIPRWHPDVNPLDPYASIDYAASYLATLRNRFGSWELALAAYNWGQGNLSRVAGADDWLSRVPTETRNYVTQISADVGRGVLA